MAVNINTLKKMKSDGEKIVMLTCTDASFASVLEEAGVEALLVGDSLGMVIQGHDSTLPVTMEDAIYHTQCVSRTSRRAIVIGDMPFGSYQVSNESAVINAIRLMKVGAHMIKIEGGEMVTALVELLTGAGIPVCGHIGLTPQAVHSLGGYKIQGKTDEAVDMLISDGLAIQEAGASMVVLELVPAVVGEKVSEALNIPVIGIGAGPKCDGQVLNLYDALDIYPGKKPRFVKNFLKGTDSVQDAIGKYVEEVKSVRFPGPEHSI